MPTETETLLALSVARGLTTLPDRWTTRQLAAAEDTITILRQAPGVEAAIWCLELERQLTVEGEPIANERTMRRLSLDHSLARVPGPFPWR